MRKKLFCGYGLLFTVIWSTHLKYFISQIQDKLCRFGAWAKTKRGWDIGQHPVGISTSKHGKRVYLCPRIHEIEDQPGGRCRPFCNPSAAGILTQTVLALTEQLLPLALLEWLLLFCNTNAAHDQLETVTTTLCYESQVCCNSKPMHMGYGKVESFSESNYPHYAHNLKSKTSCAQEYFDCDFDRVLLCKLMFCWDKSATGKFLSLGDRCHSASAFDLALIVQYKFAPICYG